MSTATCRLSEIIIPDNRIRRSITEESVRELAEDIAKNGLYHPIVLRVADVEKDRWAMRHTLVAGERRLTAIKLLFKEERNFSFSGVLMLWREEKVPFSYLAKLLPSEALEIELHENLLRTDLDWKEIVTTRAKLHELRTAEAERKEEEWSVSDTAKELAETSGIDYRSGIRALSSANLLAPHLDDPLLKNVKSEKEAHRIWMRAVEGEFVEALKAIPLEPGEAGAADPMAPMLLKGDVRELYAESAIPHNTFDIIIVDPPYGISAEKFGDAAQTTHQYADNEADAKLLARDILEIGFRCAREDAHLFMFCDVGLFVNLKIGAQSSGWKVYRTPLIWQHPGAGHIPWGVDSFRREYDMILYAKKGNARLLRTNADIISIAKEKGEKADSGHGARKPPALYAYLMSLAALPGSYVIDPCCGSGPVFPAAAQERMVAWGVERDEEIYKSALVELERSR